MINDLILRVTYDGVVTDLDVDGAVPLRLDISQVDNQEIGEVFGVSSQNFNLPGTSNNNKFFNHGYLESAIDVPGLYDTIDCSVLRNGETLLQGNLQLNEVVTSDSGFITYDVTVSNKVVEFNEALKDKFFFEANFEDLNHTLNTDNVLASWLPRASATFKDGAIFYPLADYGFDNRLAFPTIPRLSADGSNFDGSRVSGSSANSETPLTLAQFLPAIGVREVFDKIFDQAGYAYTSSLISSSEFDDLFILFKNQDQLGVIAAGVDEGNLFTGKVAPMFIIPSQAGGYYSSTGFLLNVSGSVTDPGSNYNTATGIYTAPKDGNYSLSASVDYTNGNNNPVANTGYFLELDINGSRTVIAEERQTSATNGDTFTLNGESTVLLNQGDEISYYFVLSNQGNPDATDPIDIFVSSGWDVTAAPLSYADLPVSMSLQIDEDVKTIDLFKGLLTHFNLVAYAEQEQSKVIALETFDTWMRSGEVKDWTEKYNSAKRISIKNPVSEEPRELRFGNVEDEDRISRLAKDQTPNFQYGTLRTLSNSNLTSGEKKVESSFSPTPLAPVVTSVTGSDGAVTLAFNNEDASRFIVPHFYKFKNNAQESFKFKPKIGYRTYYTTGDNRQSDLYAPSEQFVLSGSNNSTASFIDYSTLSNYRNYPVTSSTEDLLFNSAYNKLSTNTSLYPSSGSSNFNNYWKNYIDSIYWEDGRKVTMDLFFNEYEYQDIKLNDQIIIGDNRYRINKIKGFNLTRRDIVTVELLKLYPVYSPVIASGEGTVCPTVETYPAKNIQSSSMTLSGSLLTVGSGVLEKGFVVSTTDTTPTIEEGATKYIVAGTTAGEYDYDLTGLNANTTYYYQAYVSSSQEACDVAYGGSETETTLTASLGCPAVTTDSSSIQGPYAATLFATTTATGSGIVERGFVISATDSSPEIGETGVNKKVNATGGTAEPIESWSNVLTGSVDTWLSCSTAYNFRAYVSSSECLEYGSNLTFTTANCPTASAECNAFSASSETNFNNACSETISQVLYTDYSGSWPPTQGFLDGGGKMTVFMNSGCSVASPNTYYAFDSGSATGTNVNAFLRVDDGVGSNPGDVIYIYDCEGP